MEIIQFWLSIGIALGSAMMFVASLNTPSILKWVPITAFAIMLILSFILIKICYKELKKSKS